MSKQFVVALTGLVMSAAAPCAQEDRSWHLFTQSREGIVTLLHDLTKHECDFARNRALGQPATDTERKSARKAEEARSKAATDYCAAHTSKEWDSGTILGYVTVTCHNGRLTGYGWSGGISSPGDIKTAECFQ